MKNNTHLNLFALKNTFFYLLKLLSIALLLPAFFLVTEGATEEIIWFCVIIFYCFYARALMSSLVIVDGIPTILKIDVLFLTFYYLLFYLPYQEYVLGIIDIKNNKYVSEVYFKYTNVSIIASTIGLVAFVAGFDKKFKTKNIHHYDIRSEIHNYRFFPLMLLCLFLFVFFLYLKTGWAEMLSGAYAATDKTKVTDNAIYFLMSYFSLLSSAVVLFYFRYSKKIPFSLIISFLLSMLWAVFLLIVGDRNSFFIIAIIIFAGFFTYFKKIGPLGLIVLFVGAILIYNVIEISRMSTDRSFDAIISSIGNAEEGTRLSEGSFSITNVTTRATYYLVPNVHDFFYGKFKAIGFLGIIPYSRSLFVDPNDLFVTSADVLENGMLGAYSTWGVGSNIVSDAYMDFGIFGVVILLYFFGFFASYVQKKASVSSESLKWTVIYLTLLSSYGEASRYSIDFPVRNIAWSFFIFWGYDLLVKKKRLGK